MGNPDTLRVGEAAPRTHEAVRIKPVWITVAEAIRVSSIRRTCLYARIADGTIRSTKLGGKRLISFASIEELGNVPDCDATTLRRGERE